MRRDGGEGGWEEGREEARKKRRRHNDGGKEGWIEANRLALGHCIEISNIAFDVRPKAML